MTCENIIYTFNKGDKLGRVNPDRKDGNYMVEYVAQIIDKTDRHFAVKFIGEYGIFLIPKSVFSEYRFVPM